MPTISFEKSWPRKAPKNLFQMVPSIALIIFKSLFYVQFRNARESNNEGLPGKYEQTNKQTNKQTENAVNTFKKTVCIEKVEQSE